LLSNWPWSFPSKGNGIAVSGADLPNLGFFNAIRLSNDLFTMTDGDFRTQTGNAKVMEKVLKFSGDETPFRWISTLVARSELLTREAL
jgi:hypothetical protein